LDAQASAKSALEDFPTISDASCSHPANRAESQTEDLPSALLSKSVATPGITLPEPVESQVPPSEPSAQPLLLATPPGFLSQKPVEKTVHLTVPYQQEAPLDTSYVQVQLIPTASISKKSAASKGSPPVKVMMLIDGVPEGSVLQNNPFYKLSIEDLI